MTDDELDSLGVWPDWNLRFPPYWGELRLYVFRRDRYTCKQCRKRFGQKKLNAHHIIPKEEGGSDNPKNLATMCEPCHDVWHDAWLREQTTDDVQPEDDESLTLLEDDEMILVGEVMPDVPLYKPKKLVDREARRAVPYPFAMRLAAIEEQKRRDIALSIGHLGKTFTACERCGARFELKMKNQRYCSEACRRASEHDAYIAKQTAAPIVHQWKRARVCPQCHVVYMPNQPNQQFCSPECRKASEHDKYVGKRDETARAKVAAHRAKRRRT